MTIFTVTTLLDENDAGASVASPGGTGLSLREAIALANANPGGDTIQFASALNGGTIRLGSTLTITDKLAIDGDNGAQDASVPNILITGDTLGNDKLTGSFTNVAGSQAAGTLGDNVEIFNATAGLTLNGLALTGGVAVGNGGAVSAGGGLSISGSIVSGNMAGSNGGGIWLAAASGTIDATGITGNSAGASGGGVAGNGPLTLFYATVGGNSAGDAGGGIAAASATIINATISGNHATNAGAGVSATDATLRNAIVLGNGSGNADEIAGAVHLLGGNVFGTNVYQSATDVGATTASDVFVALDPTTGGGLMTDNGWTVQIALKESSSNPAIDASDNSVNTFAQPYDFPAIPNVNGSPRDLGAYELFPTGDAPINSLPGPYSVHANTDTPITGLFVVDPDPGSGTLTTTLSVQHGQLTIVAPHGASVAGSGTSSVTLSGTVAQIDAALAATDNVVYRVGRDDFGADTLTMVTNDNGSGTSTSHTDSDHTTINVTGQIAGTSGDDNFTALPGSSRVDAGAGLDTITFDFKLTDATIWFAGNQVIVDGPNGASHAVLTGFEVFKFTDGTVNNNDANPLIDDVFYYSHYHDVWNAHADAGLHYDVFGWKEGRDPNPYFDTKGYLAHYADVKASGIDPLMHYDQFGWKEGRDPSVDFDSKHYLAAYPDVAAAHLDPLLHFLQHGMSEGRSSFADGAWG